MTNTCAAPGCRTGYKPKKKKKKENINTENSNENKSDESASESETSGKICLFGFPSHEKDPERRKTWITRVPRKDWHPKEHAKIYLCEKHFAESDFILERTDTNDRRKRKKGQDLSNKRLKDDAVPCIWPDIPAHLSKPPPVRTTTSASSDVRRENVTRREEEAENERIAQDTYHSLEELVSKFSQLQLPSNVLSVTRDNYVLLYKMVFRRDGVPELLYSVQIHADLKLTICHNHEKLKTTLIERIISLDAKPNTCSKLNDILKHLENTDTIELSDADLIDAVIEKLRDARFDGNIKVCFITEQLDMICKKPNARRYSPSMLAMAALLHGISSACYKQMYNDGFLTLPSPPHIRRLCSAVDIDSMTLSEFAIAYITARYKKLPDRERLVSILMDEVYSHQSVEFVNGNFFGAENGKVTKTMLCVMLKSIAGKYRDVVAMAPISNISADKLHAIWTDIVTKIIKIGFDPAVTMTDGHSSNMALFNKKLLKEKTDLNTVIDDESKNFPCYDNTHLFKNFYNNWSKHITFIVRL